MIKRKYIMEKMKMNNYKMILAITAILLFGMFPMQAKAQVVDLPEENMEHGLLIEDDISEQQILDNGDDGRKVVSVLGDSLGTYKGYTTPWTAYYQYYCPDYMPVTSTWWMQYIQGNNMRLGINESLGGSKVSWQEGEVTNYNSEQCMASQDRIDRLDDNGTPDVILVFGGTNDIGFSPLGEFTPGQNVGQITTFCDAYQTMLVRIKETYPAAQIICITPYNRVFYSSGADQTKEVNAFDEMINKITSYYGVRCVDLREADIDKYVDMCQPDNIHVTEYGMYKIWHMLQYGSAADPSSRGTSRGMTYVYQDDCIDVGVAYDSSVGGAVYNWKAYNLDTKEWTKIADWNGGNWASWTPKKGNYWLQVTVKNEVGSVIQDTMCFNVTQNYPVHITGTYQGGNPNGSGNLIGVSTNKNPEGSYKYEMLVLDCEKYTNGDAHPWVYGTGLCGVTNGKTFWATYEPKHTGYYWTYFRVYDAEGNMVEDQCYGAFLQK